MIYGVTLVAAFTVSSVYHGLRTITGKKIMRIIDHCDIYFLIAGTYTPILLVGVRPTAPAVCRTVFAATLNAIDLKRFRVFSMVCYLALGWVIVFALKPTISALTWAGFIRILVGGIVYTVGAVLYGVGKKIRYIHAVFHIFVVIAATLEFIGVFFCVI